MPVYFRFWCHRIALNFAGPLPNFMFPFPKYLSTTSTREGREKETRSPKSEPRTHMRCKLRKALPLSWTINLQLCGSAQLYKLRELQLDKHLDTPGLARQKPPWERFSISCKCSRAWRQLFVFAVPGRSSSLHGLRSL